MYKAIKRNHILQFLIIKKRHTLSFLVCQFLPRLSHFFYWLNHTKHVQVLSWLTRDFPFFWGISGAIRGGAANITKVGFNKCQMCDMTLRQITNAVQSFAITSVITNQDSEKNVYKWAVFALNPSRLKPRRLLQILRKNWGCKHRTVSKGNWRNFFIVKVGY